MSELFIEQQKNSHARSVNKMREMDQQPESGIEPDPFNEVKGEHTSDSIKRQHFVLFSPYINQKTNEF